MTLSDLVNIFHGTSLLIIGGIGLLTFIMIVILAKYLVSDPPEER